MQIPQSRYLHKFLQDFSLILHVLVRIWPYLLKYARFCRILTKSYDLLASWTMQEWKLFSKVYIVGEVATLLSAALWNAHVHVDLKLLHIYLPRSLILSAFSLAISSTMAIHSKNKGVRVTHFRGSLVPRPLPRFQCCNIEKWEWAWGRG